MVFCLQEFWEVSFLHIPNINVYRTSGVIMQLWIDMWLVCCLHSPSPFHEVQMCLHSSPEPVVVSLMPFLQVQPGYSLPLVYGGVSDATVAPQPDAWVRSTINRGAPGFYSRPCQWYSQQWYWILQNHFSPLKHIEH